MLFNNLFEAISILPMNLFPQLVINQLFIIILLGYIDSRPFDEYLVNDSTE